MHVFFGFVCVFVLLSAAPWFYMVVGARNFDVRTHLQKYEHVHSADNSSALHWKCAEMEKKSLKKCAFFFDAKSYSWFDYTILDNFPTILDRETINLKMFALSKYQENLLNTIPLWNIEYPKCVLGGNDRKINTPAKRVNKSLKNGMHIHFLKTWTVPSII